MLFKNGLNYEPLYLHSFKIDAASHVKFTENDLLDGYNRFVYVGRGKNKKKARHNSNGACRAYGHRIA